MIEELKNTDIVNKLGGKFKLSALMQKRMVEIMHGSRPLIEDTEGKTTMEIVVEEIKQGKIEIDNDPKKTKKITASSNYQIPEPLVYFVMRQTTQKNTVANSIHAKQSVYFQFSCFIQNRQSFISFTHR